MGIAYTTCDDGEIECPACGVEFKRETWEMQVGCDTECKACGVALEVTEIDYSRTLYWSTRDAVSWSAFCQMWSTIGWIIHYGNVAKKRRLDVK